MLESATYTFKTGVINLDKSLVIQPNQFDNIKTKLGNGLELLEKNQPTSAYLAAFYLLYIIVPHKPNAQDILTPWFDLLRENSFVLLIFQTSNQMDAVSKQLPKNMSICQSKMVETEQRTDAVDRVEKHVSFITHHFLTLCGCIEDAGSTRLFPHNAIEFHNSGNTHHVYATQENNFNDLMRSLTVKLANLGLINSVTAFIAVIELPEDRPTLSEFLELQELIFASNVFNEDDIFWLTPCLFKEDSRYKVTLFIAT